MGRTRRRVQASKRRQALGPIISGPEGVSKPIIEIPRDWRLPFRRVAAWWDDLELDVTWPWIICAELAWLFLGFAVATQPFTRSLHWFWFAILVGVQAIALQRLAVYVRSSDPNVTTDVRPNPELEEYVLEEE